MRTHDGCHQYLLTLHVLTSPEFTVSLKVRADDYLFCFLFLFCHAIFFSLIYDFIHLVIFSLFFLYNLYFYFEGKIINITMQCAKSKKVFWRSVRPIPLKELFANRIKSIEYKYHLFYWRTLLSQSFIYFTYRAYTTFCCIEEQCSQYF